MRWKCPDSNDISQKYHLEFHAVNVLFHLRLHIPSILQLARCTGRLFPKPGQSSGAGPPSAATLLCSLNVRYRPSRRSSAVYIHKIVPLLTLPREIFPSSLIQGLIQLFLSHRKSRPSVPSSIIISLLSIADSERGRKSTVIPAPIPPLFKSC